MTRTDDLGVPTWLVYAFLFLLSFQFGRGLYHVVEAVAQHPAIGLVAP